MKRKTFVMSDESINSYGFRVLTDGIDLSLFESNPIMLYAHVTPDDYRNQEVLPIGKWENVRKESGKLIGDAVFDESDEFSMRIYDKVEKGMLNACSIGIDITGVSEDPKDMIPGQTRPTITDSTLYECSIAHIPANRNALRLSTNHEVITLTGVNDPDGLKEVLPKIQQNKNKMELTQLSMTLTNGQNAQLGLSEIQNKVTQLMQKAATAEANLTQAVADKDQAKKELADYKEQAEKLKVTELVDNAIKANKILAEDKEMYETFAAQDYDKAKEKLDKMKPYKSVTSQLSVDSGNTNEELVAEYDKRHKEGTLEQLSQKDPDYFAQLKAAKFPKKD